MYIFDNRGQGNSTDNSTAPLTIQSMADSTVDLIRALGLQSPDIWGYSMGGAIVLTMLTHYPVGTVRRAVVIAGPPGGNATAAPQVKYTGDIT